MAASLLLSVAGCTSTDAVDSASIAEQVPSFAFDFLRQLLAAFVL